MENNQIQFIDIANQAVTEFGIKDYALSFIRHSDNVTFKVETPGSDKYLLRIHIPITRAMGTHGTDSQMIYSELQWLEALNQDTDLVLQKPVRNRMGSLVTRISTNSNPTPINCTLLRWIEGQSYHRDLETERTACQIGEILAKLHNHASQWEFPEGFKRPKRNIAYFKGVLSAIQPAVDDGRINPSDYDKYKKSIKLVIEMINALDINQQIQGIMHADTHKGNMLYDNGKIFLIDFSFCAFGNFMFDLGICFSDMKQCLHSSFLKGYQSIRDLPDDYQRLVEGFFIGSMVGTFSFWIDNPRAQELLARKFPQIARDYAVLFNRGEHFWFS